MSLDLDADSPDNFQRLIVLLSFLITLVGRRLQNHPLTASTNI